MLRMRSKEHLLIVRRVRRRPEEELTEAQPARSNSRSIIVFLSLLLTIIECLCMIPVVAALEPTGISTITLSQNKNIYRDSKALFGDTKMYVKLECDASDNLEVVISYYVWEIECLTEPELQGAFFTFETNQLEMNNNTSRRMMIQNKITASCPNHLIVLKGGTTNENETPTTDTLTDTTNSQPSQNVDSAKIAPNQTKTTNKLIKLKNPRSLIRERNRKPLFIAPHDGIYIWIIRVQEIVGGEKFTATTHIEIMGPDGYLSAIEYPLLTFYGVMCIVYVIYGLLWLLVSFMQWRDLLRIQFWIGGVILLGMLEKAFFYAHYHSLNTTGVLVPGAELAAEFVSCAKRTLARMLVIIMSLGFGIVKPRLGPMLHRVVGVGGLYFLLACIESYLRVMHVRTKRNELLVANIPLAFVDSGICYWIFTSLVQTTRTLRLRRNMVKLSLYRHFTNTLIFSVMASTAFMFYSMHYNRKEYCTPGWHYTWFETAFWHILFSVLLLVIMILWRPTNNNQRYAFTPLLDNPEDEDEEEEEQFVSDVYGIKMRSNHAVNGVGGAGGGGGTGSGERRTPPSMAKNTTTEEDDLRWVEENIPTALVDRALPVLDSEDEVINTKFEVSKMQ